MSKKKKFAAAVISAAFALSNVTAFAQSTQPLQTTTPKTSETVIEDSRTLTPKGNAELVDNVSKSEDLQFITVTARDGNVFYFVIDHAANSDNVYFLNTVDETDLAALTEDGTITKKPTVETTKPITDSENPEAENADNDISEAQKETSTPQKSNNGIIYLLLIIAGGAGIGVYYFKILLPKKKIEQADDIENFEFDDSDEDDETELDEDSGYSDEADYIDEEQEDEE